MVTAIKALCISENQDELACIGGLSYIGVGQPAARPGEGAHAHDMVGTCAACLDKVRRWQAVGSTGAVSCHRGPAPLGQMRLSLEEVWTTMVSLAPCGSIHQCALLIRHDAWVPYYWTVSTLAAVSGVFPSGAGARRCACVWYNRR